MQAEDLANLVNSLKEEGNQLFTRGLYREAKEKFEFGLRLQPDNKFLLSNLAGCLIQMGSFEEADEAADKVIELDRLWIRGYHRKAMALFGLERYVEAKEQMLIALQLEPGNEKLKGDLSKIEELLEDRNRAGMRDVRMGCDDFECVLCLKLLYEPVTTPCGHSFCKKCLLRSLDHSNICPLCRCFVLYSKEQPVSVTLCNILQSYFPEEYAKRDREEKQDVLNLYEKLPLFVLNELAVPGQEFPMHIFEPRYRLMIRRCMESNRKFGLISFTSNREDQLRDVGTCLEITDLKVLPDGRMFVSTMGQNRFKVLNSFEIDGYRVGKIDPLEDEHCEVSDDLIASVQHLKTIIEEIIPSLNIKPTKLSHYNNQLLILDEKDIASYIWLVLNTFPFPKDAKQYLLETVSLQQRIDVIKEILLTAS